MDHPVYQRSSAQVGVNINFKSKAEAELEERRQELKRKAEEKEMEKAMRPKKPKPKKTQPTEWEVEAVKGSREKGDKTFYQVKWVGWPKLTWEPEENLDVSNLNQELVLPAIKCNKKHLRIVRLSWVGITSCFSYVAPWAVCMYTSRLSKTKQCRKLCPPNIATEPSRLMTNNLTIAGLPGFDRRLPRGRGEEGGREGRVSKDGQRKGNLRSRQDPEC